MRVIPEPIMFEGDAYCPRCKQLLVVEERTVLALELMCMYCGYGWYGAPISPDLPDGMRFDETDYRAKEELRDEYDDREWNDNPGGISWGWE